MSIVHRVTSSFFTALPASVFFIPLILSRSIRQEYYWTSIFGAVSVLLTSALLLGFLQPSRWNPGWRWIMAAGLLAMLLALFVIALLNATPLCVGQNNGDGNNDFRMCMGYVVLYAFLYGVPYMLMLAVSAFIGHWTLKFFR